MKKAIPINERKVENDKISKRNLTDVLHQKFIEAAMSLDTSIVEPFIPENMQLQDLDKYRFLASLRKHFEEIEKRHPEDWRVEKVDYTCKHCNHGKPLASFEVYAGANSMSYSKFGYYIDTDKDGETKDIYVCKGMMKTRDYNKLADTIAFIPEYPF